MTHTTTPETDQKTRKIRLLFTGFSMGLADLVPGVSGGTVAFLFGIYDELLYTVKLITGTIPKLLFQRKFKQAFQTIPFGFLLPLVIGMVSAIFGLVHVISYLLDTHQVLVWAFFFGLVLGSAFIVSRRITSWTLPRLLLMAVGFIATFVIVGLPSTGGSTEPLAVFGTGAIAITAMILPGISGSLIMVLLGQYETIINAVAERDIITLVTFAAGAAIGLALFVRLLLWLLKQYHLAVIATLIGVMIGSLRRIWPWQTEDAVGNVANVFPAVTPSLLVAVVLIVFGFTVVFMLEKFGIAQEHNDIDTKDFNQELKNIEKNSPG